MSSDYAQRRRLAIAAAVTVVVIPAVLLLDRSNDDPSAATTVTTVGSAPPGAGQASPGGNDEPTDDTADPMGQMEPGFVTGSSPADDDDIPTIVYSRSADALELSARFDRAIAQVDRCSVPGAPDGERVTITNVDNGQIVDCYNSASIADDELVVMNTSAFAKIADLTDSPVPVEVRW